MFSWTSSEPKHFPRMVNSEFLADLSIEDLNQRYQETWVNYDGKLSYCRGFVSVGRGKGILVAPLAEYGEKEEVVPFKPQLLAIERPRGQYYQSDKFGVFYLGYPTRKQFQRGLTDRNVIIWHPRAKAVPFHEAIKTAYFHYKTLRVRLSLANLRDTKLADVFVSPQMAFFNVRNTWELYYRYEKVGHVEDDVFKLRLKSFATEISEILVDAKTELSHEYTPRMPAVKYQFRMPKEEARPRVRPMDQIAKSVAMRGVAGQRGDIFYAPDLNSVTFANGIAAFVDTMNRVEFRLHGVPLERQEYAENGIIWNMEFV